MNIDIHRVSFPDQEITFLNSSNDTLKIGMSGYAVDESFYPVNCVLNIDNISNRIIKLWNVEHQTFLNYSELIDKLREISYFMVSGENVTLKGFTKDSDWIEIFLVVGDVYLSISESRA